MARVANCKASGEGRPIGSSRGRSIGDMASPTLNQTKPFLVLKRYDLEQLLEAVVPVRVLWMIIGHPRQSQAFGL
jgi:hypothetical protein